MSVSRARRTLRVLLVVVAVLVAAGLWLRSSPELLLNIAIRAERSAGDLEERSWSWQGHDIVYLDGGDPDGELVLLVHGFAGDKDNWTRFVPYLKGAGYRAVLPDLPGHGRSSRLPDYTYDIPNQIAFVEALRAHLGVDAMHVAGNSMGGHIAAGYAATHPDRVRSLGLFNAAGVTSPTPSERARIVAETGKNPLLVESVEDFDRLLAFVFVEPPEMPRSVKQYFADRHVASRAFNEKIYADLSGEGRLMPLEPILPAITAPTLIVWGDTDRLIDVSSVGVFEAGLRDSQSVIMTACGHSPMLERPAESAEHYLAFLAGTGS